MNPGDIVIAVASAGWVFVGTISQASVADYLVLDFASVIRQWGTKRGLGELAVSGPQSGTVLDPVGRVWLQRPAHLLFCLPCEARHWRKKGSK